MFTRVSRKLHLLTSWFYLFIYLFIYLLQFNENKIYKQNCRNAEVIRKGAHAEMVRTTFDWKSIVLSEPFVTGTRNEGPFVPHAKAVPAKRSERDMGTRMAKLLLRIWSTVN